ncbi:Uncharacterised protein [uncultured Clostridium sp.]|nr:Uncharacterised protein [uncultured Clostridium sp.]
MRINICYDDPHDIDIIDVPASIGKKIECVQKEFFIWMFDKNNDHEYWVIENGKKKYCSYGTLEFVEWINNNYLLNSSARASIVACNLTCIESDNPTLYF